MKRYPSPEAQKKVCAFYRRRGVFLYEGDVFPKELQQKELGKKYVFEREIPKNLLRPLSDVTQRMLPPADSPIEEIMIREENAKLKIAINELPENHVKVMQMRYFQTPQITFEEIGAVLGVSGSRARQIEMESIRALRKKLVPIPSKFKELVSSLSPPKPE